MRLTSPSSIFLAAIFSVISGCSACRRDEAPADGGAIAAIAAIDAPFAGCAAVRRGPAGPICEVGEDRAIRVAMPDGIRTVRVPPDAEHVTVETTLAGKPAQFSLAVAPAAKIAWLDEARALRAKGDVARAKEIAAQHVAATDPTERAHAEGMLARLLLGEGRAEDAFPRLRAAIDAHRAAGRVSDAADDSFALAFALHQRSRRYDEARAVLDAAAGDIAGYPEGRARDPYYRGILAGETGDHRGALAMLREATRLATELGMTKLARNARSSTALEMQELGRTKEAIRLLRELETELGDASACERAEIANNIGWAALLAGEDARAPLERAVTIEGCTDAYVRSFALGNLARVALRDGDLDAASQRLAQARSAVKEPRGVERIANLELEGRIALARGDAAKALALFDDALAFARAAVLPLPEWSALASRAEALDALGRTEAAARAALAAEDVLDDATLLVPLGEGRGAFVADRSRSARHAVDLLVRLGRAEQAARIGRRSRARVLAGVEHALRIASLSPAERAKWDEEVRAFRDARSALDADAEHDWRLAADDLRKTIEQRRGRERELRSALEAAMAVLSKDTRKEGTGPLAPGDLELVIHPTLRGWTAIARDERGASAYAVPPPTSPAPEIGRALLEPAAARIDRAHRLRVHAYGAYRSVDVHALPFRGGPLVAVIAVDYPIGLDAPRRSREVTADKTVVVGNPTGDLPRAGEEARAVAALLPDAGPVVLLVHGDATSARVTREIRAAKALHYAGHGVYAGIEGWESALPLANGGRLTVADVLAIAPAPLRVVLSGCDAAKSEGDAEGLGLAQAFVAAGAEEVLAPVRPVADDLAAKLAARLHDGGAALADALRAASLALRDEDPGADWAAFRVLAP